MQKNPLRRKFGPPRAAGLPLSNPHTSRSTHPQHTASVSRVHLFPVSFFYRITMPSHTPSLATRRVMRTPPQPTRLRSQTTQPPPTRTPPHHTLRAAFRVTPRQPPLSANTQLSANLHAHNIRLRRMLRAAEQKTAFHQTMHRRLHSKVAALESLLTQVQGQHDILMRTVTGGQTLSADMFDDDSVEDVTTPSAPSAPSPATMPTPAEPSSLSAAPGPAPV